MFSWFFLEGICLWPEEHVHRRRPQRRRLQRRRPKRKADQEEISRGRVPKKRNGLSSPSFYSLPVTMSWKGVIVSNLVGNRNEAKKQPRVVPDIALMGPAGLMLTNASFQVIINISSNKPSPAGFFSKKRQYVFQDCLKSQQDIHAGCPDEEQTCPQQPTV